MIMWVAMRMPYGNYQFQSYLPTTVGQEDYTLPTNIIHLTHPVRLLLGSDPEDTGYQLTQIEKWEYDLLEPNPNRTSPTTGQPSRYTVYSRSLLLTPIPDLGTYLLEINWTKRPTELSGDTATPDLGSEWDEVLKQGTLERAYAGLGMYEESAYWGLQYRDGGGNPVNLCKLLFDQERDREGHWVGRIQPNEL